MADLVITAANVVPGANAQIRNGTSGAALTAGKVAYQAAADRKWKLADNNSATAEVRLAAGIVLNGASDGQPVAVQVAGDVTIGATLTPGAAYFLSDTPGGIGPAADLATGEYVCLVGFAKSTSVLAINIQYPGVVTP